MIPIIKICAVVLLTVFSMILVRPNNREFSFAVELAGAAFAMLMIVSSVSDIISQLNDWMNMYGASQGYFLMTLKAFCVVVITHFIAQFCNDSGNGLLASCVEFAGRVTVIGIAMPLIKAVVLTASQMLS